MNSIFAFMAKEKKEKTKKTLDGPELEAQRPLDAQILRTAIQFAGLEKMVQEQAKSWLSDVEPRHLSGSTESVYLKKLGHRPLTKEDFSTVMRLYGNEEQKQLIDAFEKAQVDLSARLLKTDNVGLVLKQAGEEGINYNTYYNRIKTPGLWKAEEIIDIMNVLERLKL